MRRWLWAGLCAISVVMAGCGGASQTVLPTATPAPTQVIPTATLTVTPPPTVTPFPSLTPRGTGEATAQSTDALAGTQAGGATQPATQALQPTSASGSGADGINRGAVLFTAGFEQGWPTIDEATAKVSIISGKYNFELGPYDARFISTTGVDAENLYAEVDVAVSACPASGGYGLLFRQSTGGNYYALIITCSGWYSLLARVGGTLAKDPVASGALPAGIDPKNGSHVVGVATQGDTISMYLDGQLIGQATDTRLDSGDIALYAFTESDSLIQVAFDNLEVWAIQ
jgi:hypothetical protein